MTLVVKNPPANAENGRDVRGDVRVQSLGQEDPLEERMATHSSILAWRIPMDRGDWRVRWGREESDRTE